MHGEAQDITVFLEGEIFKRRKDRDLRDRSKGIKAHDVDIIGIHDVDCGCRGDWLLNSAFVLLTEEDLFCHKRSDIDVSTSSRIIVPGRVSKKQ